MFPISALLGGVGLARSIFGGHEHPFQFHPDQNDPMLALLRRRALFDSQRDRSQTTNDVASAGLLGSDAGFAQLHESDNRRARTLEDIDNQVFAQQRMDALDEYRRKQEYERQQHMMGLGAVGDIGQFVGEQFGLGGQPQSYFDYLGHSGSNLPHESLYAASQYTPDLQPQYTRGRYL